MTRTVAIGVGLNLALALAAPSRAIAQGTSGWILWEKSMSTKGGSDSVTWEPLDGFGPVRPDGRSAIFDVSKDGVKETLDIRLLCFPGAFDPRPKPKA